MWDQTIKTKRKNPDLPQLLDFDDTDLQANRAGVLSQRQQERLQRGYGAWVIACVLAFVFALIMAGVGVFSALKIMGLPLGGNLSNPGVSLCIAMLFCWNLGRLFQREQRQWREIRVGKIREVHGTLHKMQRPTNRGQQWFIQVAGEDFFVTPPQAALFQAGSDYILYYLPFNRRIVALEQVDWAVPATDTTAHELTEKALIDYVHQNQTQK